MALALILRKTPNLQGLFHQNLAKSAPFFATQHFNLHKRHSLSAPILHNDLNLGAFPPRPTLMPSVRLMSSDHTKMWSMEKGLSAALIALLPAAVAWPNFLFDNLAAISCVAHIYWGLEAIVVDYARPIVVGNVLPKILKGLLYFITATTLGGLIYYNVSDIGIGKTVRKFWAIKN